MLTKFLLAVLLSVSFMVSSCSNGTTIPKPVCDYGTMICNTLSYLCKYQDHPELDPFEKKMMDDYLKEVADSLDTLTLEFLPPEKVVIE